jgi:MutS2 family protein
MNQNAIELLEYNKIKEMLSQCAVSEKAKEMIRRLQPSIDILIIEKWLMETTEARRIVDRSASIPLHSLTGIENVLAKLGKGMVLHPEDLTIILSVLQDAKKIKRFMKSMESLAPIVSTYALSMFELEEVSKEIEQCIINDRVDDRASSALHKARKKIAICEDKIKSKLESILKSSAQSGYIQDSIISIRNGRYVIPVKREQKRNLEGNVLDVSGSGSTVFIEPTAVKKLQDELNLFRMEEENEVYKILSNLTGMVENARREISINMETMAHYDFLFAKAKLSRYMEGHSVSLNTEHRVHIKGARHPLIGKEAIPLDFKIGENYSALLITGPNTGGKTVVLKTVGLLTMMVQSGLHVPVEEGSEFALFYDILADIGDGQSIQQSLSTFSSHIKNIIEILRCADINTLVILDELGAGTDPGEGMGLAVAVLEEIKKKQATLLATTHYSEIKTFAEDTAGFENGCMEFDINTLKPMYRLKMGKAGESNAFLIALKLGMESDLISRAHQVTYKEKKDYQAYQLPTVDTQPTITVETASDIQKDQIDHLKKVQEAREKQTKEHKLPTFKLGDCVYVNSMDRTGIVCDLENSKGEVGVMVMKKKLIINKKRLSLYIDGKSLYPEDYDFDIVFESKDDRKIRKQMDKGHMEGLEIEIGH